MPAELYPWIHLVGRILFSLVFVLSGVNHLMQRQAMTEYARARGLPTPGLAVVLSGIVLLACGLMIGVGYRRFIAAGILFLFLVSTAFLMHPFWKEEDPQAQQNEMTHFLKDLALAGAALIIAYYAGTPWPLALG
ncbi:MAG: DoxX family protein [Longimicrobiales bacterium]